MFVAISDANIAARNAFGTRTCRRGEKGNMGADTRTDLCAVFRKRLREQGKENQQHSYFKGTHALDFPIALHYG